MSDPKTTIPVPERLLREAHACMRACGWHLAPANIADGDEPVLALAVAEVERQIGELLPTAKGGGR